MQNTKIIEAPIKCQNCNKIHKIAFDKMRPGNSMKCSCGAIMKFEGDDMSRAQKSVNKFMDTIKKL